MNPEFSLAAKLAAMGIGHVIYLPDDAPPMMPTQMERQVANIIRKNTRLIGRKYTTSRCDVVTAGRTLEHALKIERTL